MIKRITTLSLATLLVLSQTARAEEEATLEELEVTLEIFEDSEQLEAFELRLIDTEQSNHPAADEGYPAREALEERMDRYEEEVASREQDVRDDEPGEDPAETERTHDGDRPPEIAEVDSADEMDELDLADEREPEQQEEHEGESEPDERISDEVIDDVLEEEPVEDLPLEEDLADQPTEEPEPNAEDATLDADEVAGETGSEADAMADYVDGLVG